MHPLSGMYIHPCTCIYMCINNVYTLCVPCTHTCICTCKYYSLIRTCILTSTPFSLLVGAVYLKNCIFKYWKREEVQEGEEVPFSIPDVSKVFIRDNIVTAIIKAPILIW